MFNIIYNNIINNFYNQCPFTTAHMHWIIMEIINTVQLAVAIVMIILVIHGAIIAIVTIIDTTILTLPVKLVLL